MYTLRFYKNVKEMLAILLSVNTSTDNNLEINSCRLVRRERKSFPLHQQMMTVHPVMPTQQKTTKPNSSQGKNKNRYKNLYAPD